MDASDSNPERSRAPPAPAKGLSPLETDREGSGEGDPLRGKGPPKGVQSLLPSVAFAGKKPRSGFPERGFAFRGGLDMYSPRVVARGVVKEGRPLLCLLSFPLSFQTKERGRGAGRTAPKQHPRGAGARMH